MSENTEQRNAIRQAIQYVATDERKRPLPPIAGKILATFYNALAKRGRKPANSGHDRATCMQCRKQAQGKD